MTDRCPCLVPGCKRTIKGDPAKEEWICQRHWSPLPKAQRRAYSRARAQAMRGKKDVETVQRLWRLMRRRAIETAFMDPMI